MSHICTRINLNHSRCLWWGQWELKANKYHNFWKVYKTCNHYFPLRRCSALPLEKGRTLVLSATLWITDSTTVQNIIIIATVSKLQRKSSYISLHPYEYTAENIVAMSLHLHHVPQADMLNVDSRSYKLFLIQKTCTFEYAAPEGSVQQCTGKWHIFGGCCEKTILHDIWLVDLIG
jgi:hypothetical protein